MHYVNRETGEIIELVPYLPNRRRRYSASRPRRQSNVPAVMFVELLPLLVGLTLVWALLTFAR